MGWGFSLDLSGPLDVELAGRTKEGGGDGDGGGKQTATSPLTVSGLSLPSDPSMQGTHGKNDCLIHFGPSLLPRNPFCDFFSLPSACTMSGSVFTVARQQEPSTPRTVWQAKHHDGGAMTLEPYPMTLLLLTRYIGRIRETERTTEEYGKSYGAAMVIHSRLQSEAQLCLHYRYTSSPAFPEGFYRYSIK